MQLSARSDAWQQRSEKKTNAKRVPCTDFQSTCSEQRLKPFLRNALRHSRISGFASSILIDFKIAILTDGAVDFTAVQQCSMHLCDESH